MIIWEALTREQLSLIRFVRCRYRCKVEANKHKVIVLQRNGVDIFVNSRSVIAKPKPNYYYWGMASVAIRYNLIKKMKMCNWHEVCIKYKKGNEGHVFGRCEKQ